jgi:hypothetical protein
MIREETFIDSDDNWHLAHNADTTMTMAREGSSV